MRRYPRLDANHHEVVAFLRTHGATVQSLASIGDGCPDLLVGYAGRNFLFELKSSESGKLTPLELEWHNGWAAPVYTVSDADSALRLMQNEP